MSNPKPRTLFEIAEETAIEQQWEQEHYRDRLIARVVINTPLNRVFDYLVPDEIRTLVQPGIRLTVPFGRSNRMLTAYCVDVALGADIAPEQFPKLKSVHEVLDSEPLINAKMLELTRWIAEHYLCGWGQVLESVVPAGVKKKAGTRQYITFQLDPNFEQMISGIRLSTKQQLLIDTLKETGQPLSAIELAESAQCGTAPIQSLKKKGILLENRERRLKDTDPIDDTPAALEQPLVMNEDQQRCLDAILAGIRSQKQETFLLHGVTGSGKTEVYMQAISEVVSYGKQVIVLVPEISLTPQTIRRFRKRFREIAVLHSHLSDAERHWQWRQIHSGKVQVVVGARSALFAPTPQLGLIIIDEEHETTFKQDSTPRYHARDVARKRAELESIPLVLGTATPTLESFKRAHTKQDVLLSMPKRIDDRPMPPVQIIDTRNDPQLRAGHCLGRAMTQAITTALKEKGQVILFFNVRGFSPVLWCQSCGEKILCPSCDTSLTWHRDIEQVRCHTCEYAAPHPSACPKCGNNAIRHLGAGTQRLETEVKAKFPNAVCERMDSDSMSKHGSHDEVLERFRHGEVQILLGTQMIAKGLDFPNVTFVGVVNADVLINQPDFRAAERAFQLLAQVAGRTGRGSKGGYVYVQTSAPEDFAIQRAAKHDYFGFVRTELENRQQYQHPPFSSLARIIIRGPREDVTAAYAEKMAEIIRPLMKEHAPDMILKGPAPAPVLRLRDHYRYHLLLSGPKFESITAFWKLIDDKFPSQEGLEYQIDVDPLNLR
jgi:primosomal protein N' (replication factor Y)